MFSFRNPIQSLKQNAVPFIRENSRMIGQYVLTLLFIGLGIWFVLHEETELHQVREVIYHSQWQWLLLGIGLTVLYIILQGLMYVESFLSIGERVTVKEAVILFLKRNFVSVFLPAGGISSLAFFTKPLEKKGIDKGQIHLASSVYAFVGILSVIAVAVPAFIIAMLDGKLGSSEWVSLLLVILLIVVVTLAYQSLKNQGWFYKKLISYFPALQIYLDGLKNYSIRINHFVLTLLYSILIELVGIGHLYIAMKALQIEPSLLAAIMGYLVSVLFLIVSPFLRGLGAIEVSMTYVLIRYGFGDVQAISIMLFYRLLEFWLPLFAGAFTFLLKVNRLLMRIFPALLLLILGLVNIISVLTPALANRVHLIHDFLPKEAIVVSNYFVLIAGLFLLINAAFMLKGLRMAWYFSIVLCCISIVGNVTKAGDYEEALFAFFTLIILVVSRNEYFIRNSRKLGLIGLKTTFFVCFTVLLYGCIGFYYLDEKHFGINFSWKESVQYTLQNFFLLQSGLDPKDRFAQNFLYSINISGFVCIAFLLYTLIRPFIHQTAADQEETDRAKKLVQEYGDSAMDYFKTYSDKLIFENSSGNCFISYRISGNFAVALECPVGEQRSIRNCIREFDRNSRQNGLKSIYYRVPENKLDLFEEKKRLFLGQEAVVDLITFSLEGGAKKSMRNAIKKVAERGYRAKVYEPVIQEGLLQKLKAVSDEWLQETNRSEIIFSQGMFVWEELKNQTILTVETQEEKIVAFVNIIPDYTPGEATYDLIRKTVDAPNGVMDFILVEMFQYLKAKGFTHCNLGFAPLSGIADPNNFPERSMKFAYEKIRSFSHYKGLRDFKDKFAPQWFNKYLIYNEDYDLFQVPNVLKKVIQP